MIICLAHEFIGFFPHVFSCFTLYSFFKCKILSTSFFSSVIIIKSTGYGFKALFNGLNIVQQIYYFNF